MLIAGAIAVGLYLFFHMKKIMPMTPQQKAAWHDKISHIMARMTPMERNRVFKEARKEKASAEGIPEQKTRLTPMEMMLALRAQAEEKASEEEQGTGFDYIRERAPYNEAVPVEKRKPASILKSAERLKEEKRRREEKIAAEREEESRKLIETREMYKNELLKNVKPKDQGYSKKKTAEDVLSELLALPRVEEEHNQEYEEEPGEQEKTQKSTDLGYSKKKTTEEEKKANEAWDEIIHDTHLFSILPRTASPMKKKITFNKSKIIKALAKKIKYNKLNQSE